MTPRLPAEELELLEGAAAHPEGVGPLLTCELLAAASLYGAHPELVESTRAHLAELGDEATSELLLAAHQHVTAPAAVEAPRRPRDAGEVLARAMATPNGLELLRDAPVELAAVLLEAHPFVIDEARERLPRPSRPTFSAPGVDVSLLAARASAPRLMRMPT